MCNTITELADKLSMECSQICSLNPFNTVTIVFSDLRTGQWFKKHHLSKNKLFANINTILVNSLFKQYLPSSEVLAHKLIAFIKNNIDNPILKAVKDYCTYQDTFLDQRLFDLAIVLSELFLKYYSLNDPQIFSCDSPHTEWQKYLYDELGLNTYPELEKASKENVFYFGINDFSPFEKKILENHIDKFFYFNVLNSPSETPKITLTSAPSHIRELENLHTKLCNLLNQGAKLSEMLVLVPKIEEYRTAIYQVFDIPKNQDNVHIPFSILDNDGSASFTGDFLEIFFTLSRQKYFSRKDFFDIINNPVVRAARDISSEEVLIFENWLDKNGIYREDDWTRISNKLLLSRLSSEKVLGIVPYEDINTKTDSILWKFVSCVDDLREWIEFSSNLIDDFEKLKEILRSWIKITIAPSELSAEKYPYMSVLSAFKYFDTEKEAGLSEISLEIIAKTILRAAKCSESTQNELFTGGLNFLKFSSKRIIPVKYCFMLGMDSKYMPGRDVNNSLDLSNISTRSRDRKACFYTTLANTSGEVFYSYVNKDLAKDEDFYESTLFASLNVIKENISIDETRSWEEVFTSREKRNKNRFEGLFENPQDVEYSKIDAINSLVLATEAPKVVKLSQLKDFLKDPFVFQIKRILPRDEDENLQNKSLEPLSLDGLSYWKYLHEMVQEDLSREEFLAAHEEELSAEVDILIEQKEEIRERIQDLNLVTESVASKPGKERIKVDKCDIDFGGWQLRGDYSWHTEDWKYFLEVAKSIADEKYISMYLSALAYWATKDATEIGKITLSINGEKQISFTLENSAQAKEILNSVFKKAYIDNYFKVVPFDLIKNKNIKYSDYLGKFAAKEVSSWRYFSKKDNFDLKEICGFGEQSFEDEWNKETEEMVKMILFYEQ